VAVGAGTVDSPSRARPAVRIGGTTRRFAPAGGIVGSLHCGTLEQVAAPIALYPDPLLAQVMMASTYPLEIVQAARFVKDNPNMKEDQLNEKLKDQTWDDSVKSLVAFPQVLDLMNNKLDWTQKLGDAFLAQQKELLDAVQRLRARAQAEGNLKSTPEQKVTVEVVAAAPAQSQPAPAPPQTVVVQQQPAQVITIEPTNPQVVYVPSYNPTVVYGAWPYPAAPPYYPYPPGYAFGAAALSFGVGMAVGAAVWGNCNWGGGNVEINNSNYQNYSKNVNRSNVASERTARAQQGQAGNRSQWQHNPENRKGVQYRDQGTQQRYNRGGNPQATQSREAFRGRAEQGRQDLSRGGSGGSGGGSGGRGSVTGGGQGGGRAQTRGGGQRFPRGAVRPVRSRAWEAAETPGASAIAGRPAGRAASGPVAAVAAEVARSVEVEEAVVVVARPVAVAGAGGVAEAEADEAEAARPAVRAMRENSIMQEPRAERMPGLRRRLIGVVLLVASLSAGLSVPASGAVAQRRFASLDDATTALIDAIRAGDRKALLAILGEAGKGLVFSGDQVADRRAGERFVAKYDESHRLEAGGGKVVLVVGNNNFPFAIPLVPDGASWRFDTEAGKER
jgi:hypothetical protein